MAGAAETRDVKAAASAAIFVEACILLRGLRKLGLSEVQAVMFEERNQLEVMLQILIPHLSVSVLESDAPSHSRLKLPDDCILYQDLRVCDDLLESLMMARRPEALRRTFSFHKRRGKENGRHSP
jgi:hypothetical protein